MSTQEIEVLVVGAGQAGVAMSEHLNGYGVPHLVVERHRIPPPWRPGAGGLAGGHTAARRGGIRWSLTDPPGTTGSPASSSAASTPIISPRRNRSRITSLPTRRRS